MLLIKIDTAQISGIIHQKVETIGALFYEIKKLVYAFFGAKIRTNTIYIYLQGLKFFHTRCQFSFIRTMQKNFHTFTGEAQGNPLTNASARTRNQRYFLFKFRVSRAD